MQHHLQQHGDKNEQGYSQVQKKTGRKRIRLQGTKETTTQKKEKRKTQSKTYPGTNNLNQQGSTPCIPNIGEFDETQIQTSSGSCSIDHSRISRNIPGNEPDTQALPKARKSS